MWSESDPVYVIAEAGSNHDGDLNQALELVSAAADAGADAVKFQCIEPFKREWIAALQTQVAWCEQDRGQTFHFLATPFDVEAVKVLDKMDVPAIKIASPEIVNLELVRAAAETKRPLILSTGMATYDEILEALELIDPEQQRKDIAVLQCTTRYPTPADQTNLLAMDHLRWQTGELPIGLSDHSLGIAIPIAATALGARIIEKHFTLDKTLEGPDHHYALEPAELKAMVEGIRQVEQAMGDGTKGPQEGELIEARGRRITWTT